MTSVCGADEWNQGEKVTREKIKKRKKIKYTVLPIICLAAFLCACGLHSAEGMGEGKTGRANAMESTPVVDYTVPKLYPNVLVDAQGYRIAGNKLAAVRGKKLPDTFDLVDAKTGEAVFHANLVNQEYSAEQGLYSAYADFREWSQEGSYYLECEYVGRSHTFLLEEDLYDKMFADLYQVLTEECKARTATPADINRILLSYEWYGEVFPDENRDGTADVLETVADWIKATGEQPVAQGQEAAYVTALTKFSYLYQKSDRQFATDCLKRASVVFDQMPDLQEDADFFHALTELYRATGLDTYGNQIVEYRTYFESHSEFTEGDGYLYGAMTYLVTRHPVDRELCTIFMNGLMEQGETVSGLYEEMLHPVTPRNNGESDLLRHALELASANYVVNNYQYNHIMEEMLHYLRGRNALSMDFYASGEEEKSRYLIILAQLLAVKDTLGET